MRNTIALAALCAISTCTVPSSASATPLEDELRQHLGTMWVKAYPTFRDGTLDSCYLEYNVLGIDPVYKQGALINISGSIGLMVNAKGSGIALKVVVADIDSTTGALTPSAPTSAYFVTGFKTTKDALINSFASDTPGGYFSIFNSRLTLEPVLESLLRNDVKIAFARRVGGLDVQFSIDPRVIDTDEKGKRTLSPEPVKIFSDCNTQMIDAAIKAEKKN